MKKILMIIAVVAFGAMALNNVTVPHTWVTGDTIKRDWMRSNSDTIYTRMNSLNDSLEVKWVRFTDVKDSTFQKVKCDSIRSNPDMDSIQGHPIIDTLTVGTNATVSKNLTVTGQITGDTLVGALTIDSLRIGAGQYFNSFLTATFACTLKIADSVRAGTATYNKIGKMVFLTIPQFAFANSFTPGVDSAQLRNIPTAIRPTTASSVLIGADSTNSGNGFYNMLDVSLRNASSFKIKNTLSGNILVTSFGYFVARQTLVYYCD